MPIFFVGLNCPAEHGLLSPILHYRIIDVNRKMVKQSVRIDDDGFFNIAEIWKLDKRPIGWHKDEQHLPDDSDYQKILK